MSAAVPDAPNAVSADSAVAVWGEESEPIERIAVPRERTAPDSEAILALGSFRKLLLYPSELRGQGL